MKLKTKHYGLHYNTLQLDIGLQAAPESSDWQSHLLYVSAQHWSPPGLRAQPPLVRYLHSQTSRKLYFRVWGWHHHHRPHINNMRLHIGRKSTVLQNGAQRTIYCSTSVKARSTNMIKALKENEWANLQCFGHRLHNCIGMSRNG